MSFKDFKNNPKHLQPIQSRDLLVKDGERDEVVIGGFGMKSKDGAIQIIEKIIDGK